MTRVSISVKSIDGLSFVRALGMWESSYVWKSLPRLSGSREAAEETRRIAGSFHAL